MLQRLNFFLGEELLYGDGLWTRDQLGEMDRRFVAALELAFAKWLESRAAAAATYAVNGKQHTEVVIEAAWRWFRDAKFEATAVEVVARCPGVAPARIRAEFKRRLIPWVSREFGG
jgi:hypothetical protein